MIDFHAHLDLYADPSAAVRHCVDRGLYVLSVTTTPSAWRGTSALANGVPKIRTALGLHPQIAHDRAGELPLFARILPDVRYVGEIGLDGAPEYRRHWQDQRRVFRRVLELCTDAGGRIMTIHSRRAATAVLDDLAAHPARGDTNPALVLRHAEGAWAGDRFWLLVQRRSCDALGGQGPPTRYEDAKGSTTDRIRWTLRATRRAMRLARRRQNGGRGPCAALV